MTALAYAPPGYSEHAALDQPGRAVCGTCERDVTSGPCPEHGPRPEIDCVALGLVAQQVMVTRQASGDELTRALRANRLSSHFLSLLEPWGVVGRRSGNHHREPIIHEAHVKLVKATIMEWRGQLGGNPTPLAYLAMPPLTAQFRQIIEFVAEGMSNTEIGAALKITEQTVKTHLKHIRARLGDARDRSHLVHRAHQAGLFGGIPVIGQEF